jgi:hypothetical protein
MEGAMLDLEEFIERLNDCGWVARNDALHTKIPMLYNAVMTDHLVALEAKCNDCCYLKGFPIAKDRIVVLEAEVIQKDYDALVARLRIAAMSKRIATGTAERNNWKDSAAQF